MPSWASLVASLTVSRMLEERLMAGFAMRLELDAWDLDTELAAMETSGVTDAHSFDMLAVWRM